MRRFSAFLLFALVAQSAISRTASAAIIVSTQVDELGNGTSSFPILHSLVSGPISDPTGGLGVPVLAYSLPYTPVSGDWWISETPGGAISDVIRFSGNTIIFYSDTDDTPLLPADTGLPGNSLTNVLSGLLEVALPGGGNGLIYTPNPGEPGFLNSDFAVTYTIQSDTATPEPASALLLMAGIAGFALLRKWRTQ